MKRVLIALLALALSPFASGHGAPAPNRSAPASQPAFVGDHTVVRLPVQDLSGPIEIHRATRPGVTKTASWPPDTLWFGGTQWSAANSRWEAIPGGTWTFDSGVGSHFVHEPGTCKDPTMHAAMEGWTGVDLTAPTSRSQFRRLGVSDFVGTACVGSTVGLSGDYSFWVGLLEEEADFLCWASGQGYGNYWNTCLKKSFSFDGTDRLRLEYDYVVDTEPGWDYVYVYCDTTDDGKDVLTAIYTGTANGSAQLELTRGTNLRSDSGPIAIRFCFRSDVAYSDEDGLYTTSCGALALDDVLVSNLHRGGTLDDFSDFESGENGWSVVGDSSGKGGDWSDLVSLNDLPALPDSLQPCSASDSVLAFIDPATGQHPLDQDNVAVSPWIDLEAASAVGLPARFLEYGGYFNLALTNYVYIRIMAQWYPDTCAVTGEECASTLTDLGNVFYHFGVPTCTPVRRDLSGLVPADAKRIRIALGAVNYCRYYANCTGVSNATPLFDNVRFGTGDFVYVSTLQAAINAASTGDTLWVPPGTYTGSGNRNLNFGGKNLVLIGRDGPDETIIDCGGNGRGFIFQSGEDTTSVIEGFTITNGRDRSRGGAILVTGSSGVSIRNCLFQNNSCDGRGGALALLDSARVVVQSSVFLQNEAVVNGGAMYTGDYWTALTLDSCLVSGNTSGVGGGLYDYGAGTRVTNSTITQNTATSGLGAGSTSSHPMEIYDSVISENIGSGLHGRGTISGCQINDNTGAGAKGGYTVIDCTVAGNGGRGLILDYGLAMNSIIRDNAGGGVALYGAQAIGCSIVGNSAETGGGVVAGYNIAWRPSLVDSCLILGNVAVQSGGGVNVDAGGLMSVVLQINRTTIAGNRAKVGGGVATFLDAAGCRLEMTQCAVWGNHADSLGNDLHLIDTTAVVTVTCSAIDTTGIAGHVPVQFIGPQVYDYPMFCAPEPWYHAPTTAGDYHLASNSPCLPESSPCDSLIGALGLGCGALGTPDTKPPVTRAMLSAWPNPAYGAVQIAFAVPEGGAARIEIFDVTGRLIRRLEPAQSVGAISWDRRSNTGARAPNGIYFLRLVGETETVSRRLVLID